MSIGIDTNSIFPNANPTMKSAVKQTREINEVGSGGSTVAQTEEQPKQSIFSMRRELTPEEQRRVEFLKNILMQTLTMAQGDLTDEQKQRIREVEAELEKITGVKTRSRISNVTDKMPKRLDEEEEKKEEERKRMEQAKGIDPKDAVHGNIPIKKGAPNPGMQMLRNNALFGALQTLDASALGATLVVKD